MQRSVIWETGRTVKKERELRFLFEATAISPAFPTGEIVCREAPDFLIRAETETLGVEVVDYIRGQTPDGGSPIRGQESQCKHIAETAKKLFAAKCRDSLEVSLSFHQLNNENLNELAATVAKTVHTFMPKEYRGSAVLGWDELRGAGLGHILSRIRITRLKDTMRPVWAPLDAGFIGVSALEVQGLIGSHQEKIGSYLQHCDSIWLLIVAGGESISRCAAGEKRWAAHQFQADFNRVFFSDRWERTVIDLAISKS